MRLPSKNTQPYGILDRHIHKEYRIETSQHHNKVFCDLRTTLPNSKGSAHISCSSSHQPGKEKQFTKSPKEKAQKIMTRFLRLQLIQEMFPHLSNWLVD